MKTQTRRSTKSVKTTTFSKVGRGKVKRASVKVRSNAKAVKLGETRVQTAAGWKRSMRRGCVC